MSGAAEKTTSTSADFTVRHASSADADAIYDFYMSTVPDWALDGFFIRKLLEHFPGCFIIGSNIEGAIVGIILAVQLDEKMATVSNFVVKENIRGNGLGRTLIQKALLLRGERNVYVSAMKHMVSTYEKFDLLDTRHSETYIMGTLKDDWDVSTYDVTDLHIREWSEPGVEDSILDYEKAIYPVGRDWFLRKFVFKHPTAHVFAAFSNDRIVGYGFIRLKNEAFVYNFPVVYGNTDAVAGKLYIHLLRLVQPGGGIFVIMSSVNNFANDLIEKSVVTKNTFKCARMTSRPMDIGLDKAYFYNYCDCALI